MQRPWSPLGTPLARASNKYNSARMLKKLIRWPKAWGDTIDDVDISRDARMMVPVYYDVGRKRTKVWAILA